MFEDCADLGEPLLLVCISHKWWQQNGIKVVRWCSDRGIYAADLLILCRNEKEKILFLLRWQTNA